MPDLFLLLKLVHILAVALMVGATAINGVIHNRARGASPIEATALLGVVVTVNRMIMGPSLVLLPLSGGALMAMAGYDLWTGWLLFSIGLSSLLILAFIIGARVELNLHDIAKSAADNGDITLPTRYEQAFWKAAPIGGGALVMSLAVISLMIFKPY